MHVGKWRVEEVRGKEWERVERTKKEMWGRGEVKVRGMKWGEERGRER